MDIPQSAVTEIIRQVLDAWVHRDERNAASEAGKLTFWRDGMLAQLEEISAGKATKATFDQLRKNFEQTGDRVNHSMEKLKEARSKLAGGRIASQIDRILFDFDFGKSQIRSDIQIILELGEQGERARAQHVCNNIRTLNAELERLNRMVRE
jgi:hypothetical protein